MLPPDRAQSAQSHLQAFTSQCEEEGSVSDAGEDSWMLDLRVPARGANGAQTTQLSHLSCVFAECVG